MRSEMPSNRNQLSPRRAALSQDVPYQAVFGDVSKIIDAARESAARSVTAAYWLIGRRIVEFEQSGEERAEYGAALVEKLAEDLTVQFGRGFSLRNIYNMRLFYLAHPTDRILQTPSAKLAAPPRRQILQTPSGISASPSVELGFDDLLTAFPLPWSAYVRLLSVRPAGRLPVLRAHSPLQEQGRHAHVGTEAQERRGRASRRTDQGPLRPRVPGPQGRVL